MTFLHLIINQLLADALYFIIAKTGIHKGRPGVQSVFVDGNRKIVGNYIVVCAFALNVGVHRCCYLLAINCQGQSKVFHNTYNRIRVSRLLINLEII